jgi:hypothetical protein
MGGPTWKRSFEVLKPGGCIVSLREQPDADLAKKFQVRTRIFFRDSECGAAERNCSSI